MNAKHFLVVGVFSASSLLSTASYADGSGSGAGSWIGYVNGGNQASGTGSAVTAGSGNVASGQGAFVGAGTSNQANGISSLVIGGFDNRAIAIDSVVGAGAGNRATGARSVVVGGGYNLASGHWSFIGGGGRENGSGGAGSSTEDHIATGKWSTIGGGVGNRAGSAGSQTGATVAGGERNQALNSAATVSGGTGNAATGVAATVGGGAENLASGDYSVAFGRRAKTQTSGGVPTIHAGAFVFADANNLDFNSVAANEFAVRATGGTRIVSAVNGSGVPIAGVTLGAGGGSWATLSDRSAKQDMTPVDAQAVLARVLAMPVSMWRYRSEVSGAWHMGPTAQDFHAAFGLGDSDTTITSVDVNGVALAAIQGLHQKLVERNVIADAQARELALLSARVDQLENVRNEISAIKASMAHLVAQRTTQLLTRQDR